MRSSWVIQGGPKSRDYKRQKRGPTQEPAGAGIGAAQGSEQRSHEPRLLGPPAAGRGRKDLPMGPP